MGLADIHDQVAGNLLAILAKVFIDGHVGSSLSLDRIRHVRSNNPGVRKQYTYFI
jgi:hypothetical protein